MQTKLNQLREPVEVEDAFDVPEELADATARALKRLRRLRAIHRRNGDLPWFEDLAESLLGEPLPEGA